MQPALCRVVAAAVALIIGMPSSAGGSEPVTCVGVGPDDSDEQRLRGCVKAARAAEGNSRALLYQAALSAAERVYSAGRTEVDATWLAGRGNTVIHYGTEGCGHAVELEPSAARDMLDACTALLARHIRDLGLAGAGVSPVAEAARVRREQLQALREGLPVPVVANPLPRPPPTIGKIHDPWAGDPSTTTVQPPPVKPTASPRNTPPIGLSMGAGLSGALTVAWGVTLATSANAGQRAWERLGQPSDGSACVGGLRMSTCDDLERARRLYVASAVMLGISAAATVLLVGLLVRHKLRRKRQAVFVAPRGGLELRF